MWLQLCQLAPPPSVNVYRPRTPPLLVVVAPVAICVDNEDEINSHCMKINVKLQRETSKSDVDFKNKHFKLTLIRPSLDMAYYLDLATLSSRSPSRRP